MGLDDEIRGLDSDCCVHCLCVCGRPRQEPCVCVWPLFTPEAGGLQSPCPFVLCPVNGRSGFAPAAA